MRLNCAIKFGTKLDKKPQIRTKLRLLTSIFSSYFQRVKKTLRDSLIIKYLINCYIFVQVVDGGEWKVYAPNSLCGFVTLIKGAEWRLAEQSVYYD